MRPLALKIKTIRNHHFILALYCLGIIALTFASRNDPFFWDTVQLGSKHAHFFFENGLHWLPLPVSIDSGHPPVFGYYLALVWTFFGKTLPLSHFAVLPFLLLNVILLWRLGHRIAGNTWGAWLPIIVFLDPVLLGQSVMVSPDVVVVTGFLFALQGLLGHRKYLIWIGILVLCTISMRGMMTAAALFTWATLLPFLKDFDFRKLIGNAIPFVPGFAFAAGFLFWHWHTTGWIGYHPASPWAGAFNAVDVPGFCRNIAIVGWRWLDFGRVGELMVLVGLVYWKTRRAGLAEAWSLLIRSPFFSMLICLLLFLLPSALLYHNLSAHRYFLPAFVCLHLLVFQILAGLFMENSPQDSGTIRSKKKLVLFLALVLSLATGNFWVYPRGISMDWDSTLAHWPYHSLRADAATFLESRNIDFTKLGTAFPNINTGENLMLNGDRRQFSAKDFSKNQYVMASNVYNDFSEADYEELSRNWRLVWQKKKGGVCIEIYERYLVIPVQEPKK